MEISTLTTVSPECYLTPAHYRDICSILAAAAAGTGIPYIAGFTSSGVAGGSAAAAVQSAIGNVAAGSAFSFLQSVGATTLIGTAGAPVFGAAGVAYYYMYC